MAKKSSFWTRVIGGAFISGLIIWGFWGKKKTSVPTRNLTDEEFFALSDYYGANNSVSLALWYWVPASVPIGAAVEFITTHPEWHSGSSTGMETEIEQPPLGLPIIA